MINKLFLFNLGITQHNIRNLDQVPAMIAHVQDGGYFDDKSLEKYADKLGIRKCPIMEIAEFEDGKKMIHNGHHRAISIWLAGRDFISEEEYYIKPWKYSDYEDIVMTHDNGDWMGWVTPFDVRTESRVCDLSSFKNKVKAIYDGLDPEKAEKYVKDNKYQYACAKTIHTVPELSKSLLTNGLIGKLHEEGTIL